MSGEYALRAMIHLASKPEGTVVQIVEISREWNIPESFLRKIVTYLTRAHLVATHRGIGGGIRLARPATELTLYDVILAVEGDFALNKCLIDRSFCNRTSWCAVHEVWHEAQEQMKEALRRYSLAEIASRSFKQRAALDSRLTIRMPVAQRREEA